MPSMDNINSMAFGNVCFIILHLVLLLPFLPTTFLYRSLWFPVSCLYGISSCSNACVYDINKYLYYKSFGKQSLSLHLRTPSVFVFLHYLPFQVAEVQPAPCSSPQLLAVLAHSSTDLQQLMRLMSGSVTRQSLIFRTRDSHKCTLPSHGASVT